MFAATVVEIELKVCHPFFVIEDTIHQLNFVDFKINADVYVV